MHKFGSNRAGKTGPNHTIAAIRALGPLQSAGFGNGKNPITSWSLSKQALA
jgi:hypothetical protein